MSKLDKVIEVGIVYKLLTNNKQYIGSTTDFIRRKNEHRTQYKSNHPKHVNKLLYKNMREVDGKFFMEIVSMKKNISMRELRAEEERCRILYNAELNMNKCC